MKKICQFFNNSLAVVLLVAGMTGCREKVDLNNIDTRVNVKFGVALPVGDIKFTANDFLGGGQVKKIFLDQDGSFFLRDTVTLPLKEIPTLDMSQFIKRMDDHFKVNKYIDPAVLDDDGFVTKKDTAIDILIDKKIKLDDVNTGDPNTTRLDSVQVAESRFDSYVDVSQFGLKWDWVDKVDIVFNKQFTIEGGSIVRVYTRGDGYGYNIGIPVHVNQFTLNLMKDIKQQPGWDNVKDSIGITFVITFTLPEGNSLQITDNSEINYRFETKKIDYRAAWGWFFMKDSITGRESLSVNDLIGQGWKDFTQRSVKVLEPELNLIFMHHQSVPLLVTMEQLYTKNATELKKATWSGAESHSYEFNKVVNPTDSFMATARDSLVIDYTAENGHLDNLFQISVDSICYQYLAQINPDKSKYPYSQHRLTNKTQLNSRAVMKIPFKLDKGSQAQYVSKIFDVNFEKLNIDSLMQEVLSVKEGKANDIKLYLQLTNALPWKIDAKVWFLRQDSSIMDINLFSDKATNQLTLPAPKMMPDAQNLPYGKVVEPSVSTTIVSVTREQLNTLSTAKHMKIDAYAGENTEPCVIDTSTWVKAQIGVAASVEAILNLNKK